MKGYTLLAILLSITFCELTAQPTVPSGYVVDTIISTGSNPQPIAFAFLDPANPSTFFVAERASGRVRLVLNGVLQTNPVLDLPVSVTPESGLLGLVIDPNFEQNGFVYLYYSLSSTGTDTTSASTWLENRLERYYWNGTQLVDPVILHTIPNDTHPLNTNYHFGGFMRFGPDGKLYLSVGDLNRGSFSNPRIETNTGGTAVAGGGGIYRLNPDGSIPLDNPFLSHSDPRIQKLWAYGIRNSFGMEFDPLTGKLWATENGPEVYDEVNLIERGFNGGWRKIMGPDARDATGSWNNNTPYNASDLIMLPNAYYGDPKFSWLTPIGVADIFFVRSARYGDDLRDQALIGDANNGALYLFPVNTQRDDFALTGNLADKVADSTAERNLYRWSTGWGVVTDMKIGGDGYLYVCSVYTPARGIFRIRPQNPPEVINGQVRLEGRAGIPLGVPLSITLLQSGSPVQSINTPLDAYGRFSERVNAPGNYAVRAKAGTYLSVVVPSVSIASQGYAYLKLNFTVNGDVNGDDVIDDADLLAVLFAFGGSGGSEDLNQDGVVDDADLLIVLFNFGASG
ncbi:MAG: PQQ-dependent sugar dehydrogenase [Fimbriimonadales bacterium]